MIIKNRGYELELFIIVFAMIVFSYVTIIHNVNIIGFILGTGICSFALYKSFKKLKDKKPKIIINEKGIEICEDNRFFEWFSIKYAFIQKQTGYQSNTHFIIKYVEYEWDTEYLVDITDFYYREKQVAQTVNFFSGREISGHLDFLSNEIEKITGNWITNKIVAKAFELYFEREQYFAIFIFLMICFFAWLQARLDFSYTFAFGLLFSVCFAVFIGYMDIQHLKREEEVYLLGEEQFETIKNEFAKIYGLHLYSSKIGRRAIYVFTIFAVAAAFVISYFASR